MDRVTQVQLTKQNKNYLADTGEEGNINFCPDMGPETAHCKNSMVILEWLSYTLETDQACGQSVE